MFGLETDTFVDSIMESISLWITNNVLSFFDIINYHVLEALGCDLGTFITLFPFAQTAYSVFIGTGIGLILLNLVWNLFKVFFTPAGIDIEDPIKLTLRSIIFIFLTINSGKIVDIVLGIAKLPYQWMLDLPYSNLTFSFESLLQAIGMVFSASASIIALIPTLILAWNYIKLILEIGERYVLLGLLLFTAPLAFATGSAKSTNNIFACWTRMIGGQVVIMVLNVMIMRMFTTTIGQFLVDPLFLRPTETTAGPILWFICAYALLKIGQKTDSIMSALGVNVGRTGGDMLGELMMTTKILSYKASGSGHFGTGNASNAAGSSGITGGLAGMMSHASFMNTAKMVTANTATYNTFSGGSGSRLQELRRNSFAKSAESGSKRAMAVTGEIARGNVSGTMRGNVASSAFQGFMPSQISPVSSFSDIEIGGGKILGNDHGIPFAMYSKDSYMAPTGQFETVKAVDGSEWYKQTAQPTVERTPTGIDNNGKAVYNDVIVNRLPKPPQKKDRV